MTVTAEVSPLPLDVSGIDDNILLVQAPRAGRLGLAAASGTVVAGSGGVGTTGIALGVLAGAALIGSSGSSGGGDGDTTPDKDPGPGSGAVFVGITVSFVGSIGGPAALLEATDTCGNTINSTTGPIACNGATANFFAFENPMSTLNSNISWTPDPVPLNLGTVGPSGGEPIGIVPPGSYTFVVIYGGKFGGDLDYFGDYFVDVPPGSSITQSFSGTLTSFAERQSFSFNVP